MLTLMAALRVLWVALLAAPSVGSQVGLAAVYGQPGDLLMGGPLACTNQPLRPDDLACAHRTLPCGTQILLQSQRSGRLATCRVLDRGPYGARLPGGRFVIKVRPEQRGTWRGVIDLSPAVANMLGVSTSEPVRMLYLRPGPHSTLGLLRKVKRSHRVAHPGVARPAAPLSPPAPAENPAPVRARPPVA